MKKLTSERGYALTVVSIFAVLGSMIAGTYMSLSVAEVKNAQHQVESTEALYLAEAGLQRALFEIRALDEAGNLPEATYTIEDFNLDSVSPANMNHRGDIDMDITIEPAIQGTTYNVAVTAGVGGASKTLYAVLRHQPPAEVFDYMYFINNWGWFYGSGIRSEGDTRSNGRFDIRYDPTMNGHVYAAHEVDTHGGDVLGLAGTIDGGGGYPYQHSEASKLPMPNLSDLSVYEDMALAQNASISVGGAIKVDGIYGDETGESGNLVLVGTAANPIVINGPVVIRGDLVIKGVVKGKGTIYTGRNIYVANNITYANGPSTPRPADYTDAAKDTWYTANKEKDIVGFAAKENIVLGDYTSGTGGSWYANSYLFSMGSEDVGVDGILGTNDANEGDGIFQPAFEDLDGDGVKDNNYGWSNVQTSVAITQFDNLPAGVTQFQNIATNNVNVLQGIFYTNHAFAGRVGNNTVINGGIISKDEAILFRDYLTLNYDERIHSRYTKEDPDWLIALGLPPAEEWGIESWHE